MLRLFRQYPLPGRLNMKIKKVIIACGIIVLSLLKLSGQTQAIKFVDAEKYWKTPKDTVLVINFWATWCKPCIEELPCFEKINSRFPNKKIKVILVSQDYASDMDTRVNPFLKKKGIMSEVWLMNEKDPNTWIDRVSPGWSGAIPATLIVLPNGSYEGLYETSFTCEELYLLLEPLVE
ncbi:MAG: TlpA family protein disulfide reductase [Sphingobacteriia bacterium]|nr:TlpA family protein disulfide reductase [Sphingobacteriia bacterium]